MSEWLIISLILYVHLRLFLIYDSAIYVCMLAQLLSRVLLLRDFMDCSPPGSSVHGIIWARILEWVTTSCSMGSSWPKNQTWVSWIGRQILDHWATWEFPPVFILLNKSLWSNHLSLFLIYHTIRYMRKEILMKDHLWLEFLYQALLTERLIK